MTPPLEDSQRRMLARVLEQALHAGLVDPYRQAWRVAGLREGVDDDEEARYAFSPRSTRGATRA